MCKFIFLIFISCFSFAQEVLPPSITLGFMPGGNPEAIKAQSVVLGEKIQNALNVPVKIFLSKNYAGLIEAVKMGNVVPFNKINSDKPNQGKPCT